MCVGLNMVIKSMYELMIPLDSGYNILLVYFGIVARSFSLYPKHDYAWIVYDYDYVVVLIERLF